MCSGLETVEIISTRTDEQHLGVEAMCNKNKEHILRLNVSLDSGSVLADCIKLNISPLLQHPNVGWL